MDFSIPIHADFLFYEAFKVLCIPGCSQSPLDAFRGLLHHDTE